jgi:EPS-associated MarR family transcriptional regulator
VVPRQITEDLSYMLLRELTQEPTVSQRSLATRFGMSAGKVNYCLRALVERGWVKVRNFRRHDNKWAYSYLLTPSGMSAKVLLTRSFLARKEQEFEALQHEIARLRSEFETAQAMSSEETEKQ